MKNTKSSSKITVDHGGSMSNDQDLSQLNEVRTRLRQHSISGYPTEVLIDRMDKQIFETFQQYTQDARDKVQVALLDNDPRTALGLLKFVVSQDQRMLQYLGSMMKEDSPPLFLPAQSPRSELNHPHDDSVDANAATKDYSEKAPSNALKVPGPGTPPGAESQYVTARR